MLDGTLDPDTASGYTPAGSTKLKVLTMASRLGEFRQLKDIRLPNARQWYAVYNTGDATRATVLKGSVSSSVLVLQIRSVWPQAAPDLHTRTMCPASNPPEHYGNHREDKRMVFSVFGTNHQNMDGNIGFARLHLPASRRRCRNAL
ncbi:MAG TPA: hypothetical protein VJ827_13810 [Rubrobacter sp.]|nr:hypothetical protein [Rubrobacter sp.]